MAQPYIGEIRMYAGNFAPLGWMFCEGQLLSIAEHDTLFMLIGTTYGGDGESTFGLPDLRGRIPIHLGTSTSSGITYTIGEKGGVETVTLTANQIPNHKHVPMANNNRGVTNNPSGSVWARSTLHQYAKDINPHEQVSFQLNSAGGSNPHNNMMPYLCVNFIISLYGIFPSET